MTLATPTQSSKPGLRHAGNRGIVSPADHQRRATGSQEKIAPPTNSTQNTGG